MNTEYLDTLNQPVPLEPVSTDWLHDAGVRLDMLRLDQLDPLVSGNKWYKLKHNLSAAKVQEKATILSFGGAWSNHIHALAAAGHRFGLSTIGVIRGEPIEEHGHLSSMLTDAASWGMTLRFLSRSDYRNKNDPEVIQQLLSRFGLRKEDVYIVPEGGSNSLGVMGCQEILSASQIPSNHYDEVWLACGTGATLSGVALAANDRLPGTRVMGVAVLKGADFLKNDIHHFTKNSLDNWTLLTDYHHGGYARTSKELLAFIRSFEQETGILLDPVYTGKLMFALYRSVLDSVENTELYRNKRLLVVHTGGLQGRRGFNMH
ncbi:pyridoxal-phosphate dependent enzyme [uncultured Endozoicomonas sp.]|uniref:1-aminocyclopropane-1-carboxylate deaminase/D-cysteine desulfhydrase n=1 Tax=uncultured Endozoicomonas sp. TaxID=432652 RepID=UPI00260BAB69|nr:pyridoxal-phosphate dependent enzyme [uncultured Endozoicomonas sp.]